MFNENSLVADAQKIMLQILCATDKICTEHHLTYWLEGGTLRKIANCGLLIYFSLRFCQISS